MMLRGNKYKKRLEEIFQAKEEFRKERSKLPIEEKIKILVQLQEIANEAAKATGRREPRPIWPIDTV
ncbi:MAG TPA: hypothetical protein VK186_13790 [Candidatus Deferrimicrobium sp.]|nr:hypothetical protein [Candidatus Deferrimicrobium sp.]